MAATQKVPKGKHAMCENHEKKHVTIITNQLCWRTVNLCSHTNASTLPSQKRCVNGDAHLVRRLCRPPLTTAGGHNQDDCSRRHGQVPCIRSVEWRNINGETIIKRKSWHCKKTEMQSQCRPHPSFQCRRPHPASHEYRRHDHSLPHSPAEEFEHKRCEDWVRS